MFLTIIVELVYSFTCDIWGQVYGKDYVRWCLFILLLMSFLNYPIYYIMVFWTEPADFVPDIVSAVPLNIIDLTFKPSKTLILYLEIDKQLHFWHYVGLLHYFKDGFADFFGNLRIDIAEVAHYTVQILVIKQALIDFIIF